MMIKSVKHVTKIRGAGLEIFNPCKLHIGLLYFLSGTSSKGLSHEKFSIRSYIWNISIGSRFFDLGMFKLELFLDKLATRSNNRVDLDLNG